MNEFPDLEHVDVNTYGIRYSSKGSMTLQMAWQLPALLKAIKQEHHMLDQLIGTHAIDAVISDNRFGMWSKKIPAVYMTHQLMIKAPLLRPLSEKLLHHTHQKYISKFDECWIPDISGQHDLAGDLAHKKACSIPAFFIGPQSRFAAPSPSPQEKKYKYLFIISGPEPQRSIFEQKVLRQLRSCKGKAIVFSGRPECNKQVSYQDNVEIYNHMDTQEMQQKMLSSELIICRPGYSSIMDLAILGLPAVFVPTPGQTEQEYLAVLHKKRGNYNYVEQKEFTLNKLEKRIKGFSGIKLKTNQNILSQRIEHLLERI
ncbi:MAG: glycosyltransferase [Bacteroidota bacterium]